MKDIVNIARICGTHHLKGVLKAFSLLEDIDLLIGAKVMAEGKDGSKKLFTVEDAKRMTDDKILLKFEEINHIDDARKLMNQKILVRRDILGDVSEEDFYLFDLIDMEVYTIEGEFIGKLTNIMSSAAHDIYIVGEDENEIMIPAVEEFVKEVNFEENKIIVELIEGMR